MAEEAPHLYVAARRVLLDALEALTPHQKSTIVVGAQAVYLRTESAVVGVAPYTTDADLAIDPAQLADSPAIEGVLRAAGFTYSSTGQPGSFARTVTYGGRDFAIPVDLMVPEEVAGGRGRRSVELVGHDRLVARRTLGLEAALVDHSPLWVAALDESDRRRFLVEVAGPGALLVAKLQKLSERAAAVRRVDRLQDKDAGDVYRLFQATSVEAMASAIGMALSAEVSATVTRNALATLRSLFGTRGARGIEMVVRSFGVGAAGEPAIRAVCVIYVDALLARVKRDDGGK